MGAAPGSTVMDTVAAPGPATTVKGLTLGAEVMVPPVTTVCHPSG